MTLSKAIELLQQVYREHGDIPIEIHNGAGDWDDLGWVELVNVGKTPAFSNVPLPKWTVRLET